MKSIAAACGALTLTAGIVILLGWLIDVPIMRSLIPGFHSVNSTVAIGMLLAGVSQLILCLPSASKRLIRVSKLCAVSLVVGGILTELAFVANWQQLLPTLWHTSPGAGFAFFLVGLSLLSRSWRHSAGGQLATWLGVIVLVLGFLSMLNQAATGGVIIGDNADAAKFVVASSLILFVVGLGLMLTPSTQRASTWSKMERRIYSMLIFGLALMTAVLMAVVLSARESDRRGEHLSTILALEEHVSEMVESAATSWFLVRQALTFEDVSARRAALAQSEISLDRTDAAMHAIENQAMPFQSMQLECLAKSKTASTSLHSYIGVLASADTPIKAPALTAKEELIVVIRKCAGDIHSQLNIIRGAYLEQDLRASGWVIIISVISLLMLLPVAFLSLRALQLGFRLRHQAEDNILKTNAELEIQVTQRTAELAASAQGHLELLDRYPGVVFRVRADKTYSCEYVNSGTHTLLGLAPEELTSGRQNLVALTHPDDLTMFLDSVKSVLSNKSASSEYRILRPDGGMRWVSTYVHPSELVDGVVQRIEGFSTDISDRKRADIRREVQLQVLSALSSGESLESTLDIVTGAVEHQCHGALCSIMVLDESGQHLVLGSAPSLPQAYQEAIDHLEIGPQAGSCGTSAFRRESVMVEDITVDPLWADYRTVAADAGLRSCWSVPIFSIDGKLLATFGLYQREPGRPSAEVIEIVEWASYFAQIAIGRTQTLRENAGLLAAEKANAAKSRFLATMGHEIRTPLNGVVGMIDLMLNSKQAAEQSEKIVSAIKESSLTLMRVVDDILEISLSESGELTLSNQAMDLRETVHTVVESQTIFAHENDVEITVSLDSHLPKLVLGDSVRLEQILSNLLSNAIKFSGRQAGRRGHTIVKVDCVDCDEEMARITLEIHDDGIGMSASTVERVMNPFVQADGSTTRAFNGAGLGLTITSRLLKLMGSELHIASNPGEGSQLGFELQLPICTEQLPRSHPGTAKALPESKPKFDETAADQLILLAEDNLMNQQVIALQLQTLGLAVEVAQDGQDAFKQWQSGRYSLLLTDFHMPKMDGFELARKVRKLEAGTGQHKPIIGITASTVQSEIELCHSVGMDHYISKPTTLDVLRSALGKWLPTDEYLNGSEVAAADTNAQSTVRDVDWLVLGGVLGTHDKAVINKFFSDFLAYAATTMAEIAQVNALRDAAKLSALAHRFKSSARTVGANALADACVRLEVAGAESSWETIERELPLLQQLYAAVIAEAAEHGIAA